MSNSLTKLIFQAELSIGKQFIDYYQAQRLRALIGIDDWADRLSYFYSVIILSLSVTIVTLKTYFLNPMACHSPTIPSGSRFAAFLSETCFAVGTVAIRPNETSPQNPEEWLEFHQNRRINYYYWVPFMLGLQLILFYLPDLIWRSLTYNQLGTNLNTLIQEAINARSAISVSARRKRTFQVAESLRLVLFDHRNVYSGLLSDFKQIIGKFCGFLIFSKRLGTWTVASYFFIKICYLANAIGQLFLMRHFLGFDHTSMKGFGLELARRIHLREDWQSSLYFPRTAMCQIKIRLLGSENQYAALCALPVNLFNEKIYMFLWFWVSFVFICTFASIPLWIWHLGFESTRLKRLKRYFYIEELRFDQLNLELNPYKKSPYNDDNLKQFMNEFLRYDGLFILEIINDHVGDVVTGEIARLLWTSWVKEYAERLDFRYDDWSNTLNLDNEASLLNYTPKSSVLKYPAASSTLRHKPPISENSNEV